MIPFIVLTLLFLGALVAFVDERKAVEEEVSRTTQENIVLHNRVNKLEKALEDCQEQQVTLESSITFEDICEAFACLAEYHNTAVRTAFPDPVWSRVYKLFEKYDIKVMGEPDRNERTRRLDV